MWKFRKIFEVTKKSRKHWICLHFGSISLHFHEKFSDGNFLSKWNEIKFNFNENFFADKTLNKKVEYGWTPFQNSTLIQKVGLSNMWWITKMLTKKQSNDPLTKSKKNWPNWKTHPRQLQLWAKNYKIFRLIEYIIYVWMYFTWSHLVSP